MRAWVPIVLGALLLLGAPLAAADHDGTGPDPNCSQANNCYDARLTHCTDWRCAAQALPGGAARLISAGWIGISAIVGGAFVGFYDYVLKPSFSAISSAFVAIGVSFGELFGSVGEGVRDAMRDVWATSLASLGWAGPFAILIAVGIVITVITGLLWLMMKVFDRGDDPLPGPLERLNKDSDREYRE